VRAIPSLKLPLGRAENPDVSRFRRRRDPKAMRTSRRRLREIPDVVSAQ